MLRLVSIYFRIVVEWLIYNSLGTCFGEVFPGWRGVWGARHMTWGRDKVRPAKPKGSSPEDPSGEPSQRTSATGDCYQVDQVAPGSGQQTNMAHIAKLVPQISDATLKCICRFPVLTGVGPIYYAGFDWQRFGSEKRVAVYQMHRVMDQILLYGYMRISMDA